MPKRSQKENQNSKLPGEFAKVESLSIFRCNCKCIFCSVGRQIEHHIKEGSGIKTTEEVKEDIDLAVKVKAKAFALSGGEPTLRPDIFELVRYAKKRGLPKVEVQSNGRMYYYKDFCEKMVKAGVDDFVVSFHSGQKNVHDKLMGLKGTYEQASCGVKNLKTLGQTVKINLVILKPNYRHLAATAKYLLGFKANEFRLTFLSVDGSVLKNPKILTAPMRLVAPYMEQAIDEINKADHHPGIFIYNFVLCLLKPQYRKYINDLSQMDTFLRGPGFEASIDEHRRTLKVKSSVCKKCQYDKICNGVWKSYAKYFGLKELKPIKNEPAFQDQSS
jgi:MoaA/NifB/PqqE/SkfB family radical SAM enzyme